MYHQYEVTTSKENQDLLASTLDESNKKYLELYGDFKSRLAPPVYRECPEKKGLFILDFAQGPAGLKAFGAEKLIATTKTKAFGYAAPRFGHAAEAIAMLCEIYNKKAVFFAPASSQVTKHQAVVLAYKGSRLRFVRIAAMPALNSWIRKWAVEFNATALPFGLSKNRVVTSGLVKMCVDFSHVHGAPHNFWCAVSTGTMIRALQIGWPRSKAHGIAVARNIKDGEIGKADVRSYHKSFYDPADVKPMIETTMTYDAKAYEIFVKEATKGSVFINVGSDQQIERRIAKVKNWASLRADRGWGDLSAFEEL